MSTEPRSADDADFVHADPSEMVVGANVRLEARLDPAFVDSIRERGVLQAVTAYRNEQQQLVVLFGQRRTRAAAQVGLPTIPVMVVAAPQEGDRLGDQVVENDHRADILTTDRVGAYEQMAALGLTAGQIAKRAGRDRTEVATALTVAGSKIARAATERYDFLDLTQAAVLAEFEGDAEAITSLVVAAKKGGFEHLAQRLRDKRADDNARRTAEARITAGGVAVVDEPAYNDPKIRPLSRLMDADRKPLDSDEHYSCPGHAAYLDKGWRLPTADDEPDTGETDTGDQDDEEAEDGDTDDGQPRTVYGWMPKFVCTDFAAHAHQDRYAYAGAGGSQKKTAAEMTEQERAAASAARRDVIQSNKDWLSATTVRRTWLQTLLARKTVPKAAAGFLAGSLARPGLALADGYHLGYELLSLQGQTPGYSVQSDAFSELVTKSSEARAQVLALALVLAALEEPLKEKSSWRDTRADTVRYLRFLADCGYPLAAIERRACGDTIEPVSPDEDSEG